MPGYGLESSRQSVKAVCQGISICLDGLPLVEKSHVCVETPSQVFYIFYIFLCAARLLVEHFCVLCTSVCFLYKNAEKNTKMEETLLSMIRSGISRKMGIDFRVPGCPKRKKITLYPLALKCSKAVKALP